MSDFRILPAGDTALVVEFGERIDRDISARVLALSQRVEAAKIAGVIETVPTFRSLMVCYEPLTVGFAALCAKIADLAAQLATAGTASGRAWRLPVCYDAELAPDLADVAARTGLTPAQVVECHSANAWHVYMLGFLPGQAYMGDVPKPLQLPRRTVPRTRIPAGSLAIATGMTCIFPMQTPCGWHLIGRSPVPLWDRDAESRALLAPGDRVTFAPVSMREYADLAAQAERGLLRMRPLDAEALEHAA
jgi:inhibitor of KinA